MKDTEQDYSDMGSIHVYTIVNYYAEQGGSNIEVIIGAQITALCNNYMYLFNGLYWYFMAVCYCNVSTFDVNFRIFP